MLFIFQHDGNLTIDKDKEKKKCIRLVRAYLQLKKRIYGIKYGPLFM